MQKPLEIVMECKCETCGKFVQPRVRLAWYMEEYKFSRLTFGLHCPVCLEPVGLLELTCKGMHDIPMVGWVRDGNPSEM